MRKRVLDTESSVATSVNREVVMAQSTSPEGSKAERDLTSTIHLSDLRSVKVEPHLEEIFAALSPEERTIVGALPKNSAMFIVIAGPERGARFLLDADELSIGRDAQSDIYLDDATVSRLHARLQRGPDGYELTDLGSLNGTYVNSRSVNHIRLLVGDEVHIGKFRLTYFTGKGNS